MLCYVFFFIKTLQLRPKSVFAQICSDPRDIGYSFSSTILSFTAWSPYTNEPNREHKESNSLQNLWRRPRCCCTGSPKGLTRSLLSVKKKPLCVQRRVASFVVRRAQLRVQVFFQAAPIISNSTKTSHYTAHPSSSSSPLSTFLMCCRPRGLRWTRSSLLVLSQPPPWVT